MNPKDVVFGKEMEKNRTYSSDGRSRKVPTIFHSLCI